MEMGFCGRVIMIRPVHLPVLNYPAGGYGDFKYETNRYTAGSGNVKLAVVFVIIPLVVTPCKSAEPNKRSS